MDRLYVLIALVVAALPCPAWAWDESSGPAPDHGTTWLADQLETVRRANASSVDRFDFAGTNIWVRGLEKTDALLPVAPPPDKAMGAKLRPFKNYDFLIGTELSGLAGADQTLRSEFNWQASWTRDWEGFGGMSVGLQTTGSVESLRGGVSQSLAGSLRFQVLSEDSWATQVRISPQVSFDSLSGTWRPSLAPEIVSETFLNSSAAPIRSLLRFRLGYDFAPDSRPSAAAKLELRLLPRT